MCKSAQTDLAKLVFSPAWFGWMVAAMRPRSRHDRPSMTSRGRGLLAASLISIVGGMLGGGSILAQLGILGLVLLVVARRLSVLNIRGLKVSRSMPDSVFSGADFEMELSVENPRKILASKELSVSDRLLPFHDRGISVAELSAGDSVTERFRTRIVGRGRFEGLRYRVESEFPLGLFSASRRRRGRESVLVYPRPVLPAALRSVGADGGDEDAGALSELGLDGELRGIREFQRGDPLKQVLWPMFARSGQLAVREYDRPLPEKYSLVIHSYCPPGKLIWPEAFEHSLSLLTGLLFLCRERNVPLDLCGAFSAWERIEVRDPQKLADPLELLAQAQHLPAKNLDDVSSALNALPGSHPVFVVSEAPVRFWADKLPPLRRVVTCLDNTTLRVKRSSLAGFRSVA